MSRGQDVSEQRNELPEGWAWMPLGDVCAINPRHPKGVVTDDTPVSFVPMAAVDHQDGAISGSSARPYDQVRKGFTHFAEGDVLFARITPCMENGKIAIARGLVNGLGCGTTEFHVLRPFGGILSEYIYRYLRQESFRRAAAANMSGTAGQLRVPTDYIKSVELPLAPLAEQRRIVAKIEALFEQSRAARQALDRIPPLLKKFRQSILASAFRGDLTRDWREAHSELDAAASLLSTDSLAKGKAKKRAGRLWGAGVVPGLTEQERLSLPGPWAWTKVRNLGENPEETVQVGPMSMRSREFTDSGIPVLNVGCVKWGHLDETKLDHLPLHIAAKFGRYRVAKDDILFTRSGTVGRCAIATERHEGYLMTFHLLRVRVSRRKCLPEYLQLVFQGAPSIHRQTDEAAIGSTRAGFNTNLLADLDVPLPQQIEQHEIVNRVKRLFKLADAIETTVKMAQRRAEILEQSILSQAFRGELVPHDPTDEPASALLDGVRAVREKVVDVKKRAALSAAKRKRQGKKCLAESYC